MHRDISRVPTAADDKAISPSRCIKICRTVRIYKNLNSASGVDCVLCTNHGKILGIPWLRRRRESR